VKNSNALFLLPFFLVSVALGFLGGLVTTGPDFWTTERLENTLIMRYKREQARRKIKKEVREFMLERRE